MDELLSIAKRHLKRGSIAKIAKDLNVSISLVSRVANGQSKSSQVEAAILKQAQADKAVAEKEERKRLATIKALNTDPT